MELRHLRYFVAVAEELNFTKAALRMHTVQPSLSQQIKDLEEEVGVQLFIRSKRKVELTQAGDVFFKEALIILEHTERAVSLARQVAKEQQEQLNIGVVPVAEMKIFPYIIPNIRAHFPELKIDFHSLTDDLQLNALKKGEIDIAFTRYGFESDDITSIQVFQEPLTLIIPKNSAEVEHERISIKRFEQHDFVICNEGSSPQLYRIIQDFFKKNKLNVPIVQHSTNILLNVNLVGMEIGWSLVPQYVIPLLGDKIVVKKTVEPLPMIGLYVSYRKDQVNNAIELILEVLKKQFYLDFTG
ncbi:LysR family transcriptional regulator [Acinetobacter sp. S40]|uniref:LysR substrate-binding domain-containing protein n=1 Tax=unclassified Acinetobacter TaxID=196816 RepID=UPI00190C420B|nr:MULTISPECIES: LysR substrate-binding domain-containing protein [unclassified Acinetobacter]MBJ9984656.1 LysR family transcriptional regulator [Acinetobacter sp. S40]MBK0062421.1 LysR family transcriptional regulator [Acinetobacter sp. S55]MBK0066225.1 LysR family transcriptional regulator [Acinetobacter sp. S54]